MSLPLRLAGAVLVLGLASCTSIKTSTNYDPNSVQAVGSYRTYAWLPMTDGADPRVYNPIIQARVQLAVDRELQARGYQKVTQGQDADFKLILDVVDGDSNKLVWRGMAEAELAGNMDAKKSQKLINKAADELLEDFPPEPRKE
jgi:hypothetical protein